MSVLSPESDPRRTPRILRVSARGYCTLLYAYPRAFRRDYGAEMARLFRDTCRDAYRERGSRGVLRLWPAALGDLFLAAARERLAALPRPREIAAALSHGWSVFMNRLAHMLRRIFRRPSRRPVVGVAGNGIPDARDRFEKFTRRTQRVFELSQGEARQLGHKYIGTEHLLLGLMDEGGGVAAQVLANLGFQPERARQGLIFIIGHKDEEIVGEIGFTARAKKVIGLAVDEARRLGHGYIGTEHILLGMIREGEGLGPALLTNLGISLESTRAETLRVLAARQSHPDQPTGE
jgi:Clp amino terminal domain, pathogenicity island component